VKLNCCYNTEDKVLWVRYVCSVYPIRGSLFSEPRNPCSDSDDQISEETRTHASRTSGDTSICPVDTTSHSVVDHGGVLSHTTVPAQLNNTSKMISPFYAIHLLAQKLIWGLHYI